MYVNFAVKLHTFVELILSDDCLSVNVSGLGDCS